MLGDAAAEWPNIPWVRKQSMARTDSDPKEGGLHSSSQILVWIQHFYLLAEEGLRYVFILFCFLSSEVCFLAYKKEANTSEELL